MTEREFGARPWWLLPVGRVHPLWWLPIGAVLIWIEYATVTATQFPVFYVIPVSLAAWYSGRLPALSLAAVVPLSHVLFLASDPQETVDLTLIAMTLARASIIVVMALWFARLSEHEQKLLRYVVKLEGLLPICSYCKSIRNEKGHWEPLETFISERSDADFTHGLCPHCLHEHYSTG